MKKAKRQLKNWLLQNSFCCNFTNYKRQMLFVICFLPPLIFKSQIANYVNNGSFEDLYDCITQNTVSKAKGWMCVDSTKFCAFLYHTCAGLVPNTPVGYQMPKDGGGFVRLELYNGAGPQPAPNNFTRSNIKNRLKQNLQSGKTYCVRMYVSTQNYCSAAIDGFGFYFGDNSIDTIIYNSRMPLTFLTPQVSNPNGNIINDTMNWVPITGTFVANGTEKYMVISNFKNEASTNTVSTGIIIAGPAFSEYFIDAVSCIDIDLPAYAGPNISCIPGNTVYIGRPQDVGIDEACTWYNITNTNTPIGTAAGITVSPVTTQTYIVKQDICGNIKWDTVVVHQTALGLAELKLKNEELKISPNPANEFLNVSFTGVGLDKEFVKAEIFNSIGQLLTEIDLNYNNKTAIIDLKDLPNGVYLLNLKGINSQTISKRFIISRN